MRTSGEGQDREAGTLALRAFGASRQGPGRQRNQDAFLNAPEEGLFLLADGIGGLDHGERASWGVVATLEACLPLPIDPKARVATVEATLHRVNADLLATGRAATPPYVMGTTVAAVLVEGQEATCYWAGDSRIYLLRDEALHQMSADHSEVVHCDQTDRPRAMLTRAVGVEPEVDVELREFSLKPGDRLLLCSDGVHGVLSQAALAFLSGLDGADPAQRIVEEAHRAGGRDDATAILVCYEGGQPPEGSDIIAPSPAPEEIDALQRLQRACHEIARGHYSNADDLFDLTIAEDASPTLRQLAESIGFMLVQIEARELRLTGLIEDLELARQQLEQANRKLAQENAELSVTVERLRVDIDKKEFTREVGEIVETEYFQQLQRRAREMRARHGASRGPADT